MTDTQKPSELVARTADTVIEMCRTLRDPAPAVRHLVAAVLASRQSDAGGEAIAWVPTTAAGDLWYAWTYPEREACESLLERAAVLHPELAPWSMTPMYAAPPPAPGRDVSEPTVERDRERLAHIEGMLKRGESVDLLWQSSRCTDTLGEAIDAAMRGAR